MNKFLIYYRDPKNANVVAVQERFSSEYWPKSFYQALVDSNNGFYVSSVLGLWIPATAILAVERFHD